ncbi:hypothetical protein BGX29_010712 [Mortierella sp. GBA35]|nr:hypothetical protein BGX29_010712 [Mortierella sp. GBA35]
MTNHPINQPTSHALDSDSPNTIPPLRNRNKYFGLLGVPKNKAKIKAKTSSQSLDTQRYEQETESPSIAPQPSTIPFDDAQPLSASVPEGKPLPKTLQWMLVIKTELLAPQDRIEQTQQLATAVQKDSAPQLHLRWLVTKLVEDFAKDDLKGPTLISEAVILGPVLDRDIYRSLFSCFIAKFEKATILDVTLLQGFVQLIESASSG